MLSSQYRDRKLVGGVATPVVIFGIISGQSKLFLGTIKAIPGQSGLKQFFSGPFRDTGKKIRGLSPEIPGQLATMAMYMLCKSAGL